MSERRVQVPSDEQIKQMVDRFLGWRLPDDFRPDGGIQFEPYGNVGTPHEYKREPTGTNLLDAQQAEDMIRFLFFPAEPEDPLADLVLTIEGMPDGSRPTRQYHNDMLREAFRRGQQSMIRKDG